MSAIDRLESFTLGDTEQWVRIRTNEPNRPLLLVLYGGPGLPLFPRVGDLGSRAGLEDTYTVVYWEQRGTGKSYDRALSPATMTVSQFVDDLIELTDALRQTFEQEKVGLLGISWGTILGLRAISRTPSRFWGYVGSGQIVNGLEGDRRSYAFTLHEAKNREHKRALRQLVDIGTPPYSTDELMTQRKWAGAFGGIRHNSAPQGPLSILGELLMTDAYTWTDVWNVASDPFFCLRHLLDTIYRQALDEDIRRVDVPVYFLEGRHDAVTPPDLARTYMDRLEAPRTTWVWFDQSGHFPFLDEPEKFGTTMASEVTEAFSSGGTERT